MPVIKKASAGDYKEQLKNIMPEGLAWPKEDGTTIDNVVRAEAEELSRVDGRIRNFEDEMHPPKTLEMLPNWERVTGLPDPCVGLGETISERRSAVVARLNGRGGQSPQFYIDRSADLGFPATVTEHRPFRAGLSNAGHSLTNTSELWQHYWQLNAPANVYSIFRAGQSFCGERLRNAKNTLLECSVFRLKPAHTQILFNFIPEGGDGWEEFITEWENITTNWENL